MADVRVATIDLPEETLAELCRRYSVRELSLFGSALDERFGPDSDIDLLVEFVPGATVGLFELGGLQDELEQILGRKVDLVPKGGLKPTLRDSVLDAARVLYAA